MKTPDYKELYFDLLMEVVNKYSGETRHETAKRIISTHEGNIRHERHSRACTECDHLEVAHTGLGGKCNIKECRCPHFHRSSSNPFPYTNTKAPDDWIGY